MKFYIVMKISIKHSKKHLSFNKMIIKFSETFWKKFKLKWLHNWINKNEISGMKNVIKDKKDW